MHLLSTVRRMLPTGVHAHCPAGGSGGEWKVVAGGVQKQIQRGM